MALKPEQFNRLLRPRSIAVLGGGWADNVVEQCLKIGFNGDIWPVHPTRPAFHGIAAYRNLAELPRAPDATFIGVNRHVTIDVVSELAAMQAGGAVCFASGWSEAGDTQRQDQLVAAAGDMAILGPNCYGLINLLDGALLWPDQHGGKVCERGVAILSQSSNIAINLTMQRRGLPIAYVVCLGNAAQSGLVDVADAVIGDDRVTALGLYVESIADAARLADLAHRVRAAGKSIIALNAGKTETSAAAVQSHTAAIVSSDRVMRAFYAQAGIGEVETPSELIEALKIAHVHGRLDAKTFCSMSCSGGEAALVGDLARHHRLDFAPVPHATAASLTEELGTVVSISNPLDYHTFIWGDRQKMRWVFGTMIGAYDAGMLVIDLPRADLCDPASFEPALDALVDAANDTGRPTFAVSSMPEGLSEIVAEDMMRRGVVPLMGIETALTALGAAAAEATPTTAELWQPLPNRAMSRGHLQDEHRAKTMLFHAGIKVPRGVAGKTLADLTTAIDELKPPLALKGLGLAHKSELGAVRLGLTSLEGEAAMAGVTGYLLEEIAEGGIGEMLIGLKSDPVLGGVLTVGFGGVQAELLEDVATLVMPVTATQIHDALQSLRLWPMLAGYRGRAKADTDGLIDAIMKLQTLFATNTTLCEIEINPLIVRAHDVIAVDALAWEISEGLDHD